MHDIDSLYRQVKSVIETNAARIIGIDGLGGAGKSTLAEQLCQQLQSDGRAVLLLHIDDFIHPRAVRYNAAYPEWICYYDLQWRFDYFAGIINELKAHRSPSVDIQLYDKEQDTYATHRFAISDHTIVIVEGIFLQREVYNGLFDYMIYMDIPEDIRLRRVLQRDTYIGSEQQIAAKYINRYFPAERQYLQEYQPQNKADLVVSLSE